MALRRRNLFRSVNLSHRRIIESIRATTQEETHLTNKIKMIKTIHWASKTRVIRITARRATGRKATSRRGLA